MNIREMRWHDVILCAICGFAGGVFSGQFASQQSDFKKITAERFILVDKNGRETGEWQASLGIPEFSMNGPEEGRFRVFTKEAGAAVQFGRNGGPELYFEYTDHGMTAWAKDETGKFVLYESADTDFSTLK